MKVVVIGAGPSGLVACKSLLEAASTDFPFDPIVLEQEADIGGTFRYRSYQVGSTPSVVEMLLNPSCRLERDAGVLEAAHQLF
jgi:cation diffusion facilitator CzcD-associated flavoprotein CzcO